METTVFELQARSCDQVADRRANQDLAGPSEGRYAGSDVDGDTSDTVAGHLYLALYRAKEWLKTRRNLRNFVRRLKGKRPK